MSTPMCHGDKSERVVDLGRTVPFRYSNRSGV